MSRFLLALLVLAATIGAVVAYNDPEQIARASDSVSAMLRKRTALPTRAVQVPRGELRHHGLPLDGFHPVPARDLRQRASAAKTEVGSGVDHTDCDARRFYAHCEIVKCIRWLAQAPRS